MTHGLRPSDKKVPMHQVKLDDQLYENAQRRAAEAGFSTVDEYVADVVSHDLLDDNGEETPNLDHLFTPERLALIDASAAEIDAGNYFTAEQANEELARRRAEWLEKNPR
jgi:hypothetical protein